MHTVQSQQHLTTKSLLPAEAYITPGILQTLTTECRGTSRIWEGGFVRRSADEGPSVGSRGITSIHGGLGHEAGDLQITPQLEMWANAQRDVRPAEYRWRPLFNAAKFG